MHNHISNTSTYFFNLSFSIGWSVTSTVNKLALIATGARISPESSPFHSLFPLRWIFMCGSTKALFTWPSKSFILPLPPAKTDFSCKQSFESEEKLCAIITFSHVAPPMMRDTNLSYGIAHFWPKSYCSSEVFVFLDSIAWFLSDS